MAESFPQLIHELADIYHRGCLLTMARVSGFSYTSLWRWERGMATQYSYLLIRKLAERYRLNEDDLWSLIRKDAVARAAGLDVPLPQINRRRGPAPIALRRGPLEAASPGMRNLLGKTEGPAA